MAKKLKKKKSLPRSQYDPVNKNYLIVIGALIAIVLVLLATLYINRSKLEVRSDEGYIDVTPTEVNN